MSLLSELPSSPRKEEILDRSPFTRSFLSPDVFEVNQKQWYEDLASGFVKVEGYLKTVFGKEYQDQTIMPLVLASETAGIYSPGWTRNELKKMTGFVVGMGFEIADIHDADLLSRDIFERLIRIGMFADDVVSDQVRKIWALTAVDGFLRTGSLYGKALKVKLDTVDSHYLKVYEDFFKKLE